MVMDVDVGLQSAMEEVQRVLNTLPHGEDFEDEYYDDLKRAGLRRSPEEGIFGEANSPGSIFTTIFGETVNGEDLAFELRKHLERSFI